MKLEYKKVLFWGGVILQFNYLAFFLLPSLLPDLSFLRLELGKDAIWLIKTAIFNAITLTMIIIGVSGITNNKKKIR